MHPAQIKQPEILVSLRNLHDGDRCVKLFYLLISFCSFRRGRRKTFSLTPYIPTVGRSCLLNVGANNVASVYRENRKSQKTITIKKRTSGYACARKLPSNSRRSLVDLAGRVDINRRTIDVLRSIIRSSRSFVLNSLSTLAGHRNASCKRFHARARALTTLTLNYSDEMSEKNVD